LVQERAKGAVEGATNARSGMRHESLLQQRRTQAARKELCGSKGQTTTTTTTKGGSGRVGEERWRRMLERVKYDLWALEPREWLRGGKAERRKRRLKRAVFSDQDRASRPRPTEQQRLQGFIEAGCDG